MMTYTHQEAVSKAAFDYQNFSSNAHKRVVELKEEGRADVLALAYQNLSAQYSATARALLNAESED